MAESTSPPNAAANGAEPRGAPERHRASLNSIELFEPKAREHAGAAPQIQNPAVPAAVKPVPDKRPPDPPKAQSSRNPSQLVPDAVKRQFTQVGSKFHFEDGTLAFADKGNQLTTRSENAVVIDSLISIAKARGWEEIRIKGTKRFRQDVWFAAQLAGLKTHGYRPSAFERERLARTIGRENAAAPVPAPESSVTVQEAREKNAEPRATADRRKERAGPANRELIVGRLIDHDSAPYGHQHGAAMSYFVRIETAQGERTIWGVDLHRAMKESLTRPQLGDEIGLKTVRQESVTVPAPVLDAEGNLVGHKEIVTHRNEWFVEKVDFFNERAQVARTFRDAATHEKQGVEKHPQLVGTYLKLHAYELLAKQIPDEKDRAFVVGAVRRQMAEDIANGKPLANVSLKDRTPERQDAAKPDLSPQEREQALVR